MERELNLMEQMRRVIRRRNFSYRTEQAYVMWCEKFIRFHGLQHPRNLDSSDVAEYLSYLAVDRRVSAATQCQSLNALKFLYAHVLECPLEEISELVRARRVQKIPGVLTRSEVERLLGSLDPPYWLMACLMYGAGLRLMESLRLRIRDVDLHSSALNIQDGNGHKDRVIELPRELTGPIKSQIDYAKAIHKKDLGAGFGHTVLSASLQRKYPGAASEGSWQYVFPARCRSLHPQNGVESRYHVHEQSLQREMKKAVRSSGINQAAGCHTLRHSCAVHRLEQGSDTRTGQEQPGHNDVRTMQIHTPVIKRGGNSVRSPLPGMVKAEDDP